MTPIRTAHTFVGYILYIILLPAFMTHKSTRTRGVLIDENGKILLVRNWISEGNWDVPGGGLHKNEDPRQGLSREVLEETGIRVPFESWTTLGSARHYRTTFLYFKATVANQNPHRQVSEILDARWVELTNIPKKHMPLLDNILPKIHGAGESKK